MCQPAALTQRYLETLHTRLGRTHDHVTNDGSIVFTDDQGEGTALTLVLVNHAPHDPEYFQLICYLALDNLGPHGSYDPRFVTTQTVDLTRRYKALKAVPLPDNNHPDTIALSVEAFLAPSDTMPATDQLAAVIPRSLHVFHTAFITLLTNLEFHALTNPLTNPTTTPASDE